MAENVAELSDRVKAAAREFNAAVEAATQRGLLVELKVLPLQTMMGDCPLLQVRVFEPT